MSEDLSRNGAFLDLRDHAAFATTKRADQHLDSKNAAQQGGPVVTAAPGELQRRFTGGLSTIRLRQAWFGASTPW
jgi:hypothetical protein